MKVIDAIAEILRREGVGSLCCYPTTPLIEALAKLGIPPVVCRQERVGVGIADGFARVRNGRPPGVFAMQSGPGAENAVPGIATAFSDSSPILLLPLGYPRERDALRPAFSAVRALGPITKSAEQINVPGRTVDAMRRAFAALKMGRPGPVLVEIPLDVAEAELEGDLIEGYVPVPATRSGGRSRRRRGGGRGAVGRRAAAGGRRRRRALRRGARGACRARGAVAASQ